MMHKIFKMEFTYLPFSLYLHVVEGQTLELSLIDALLLTLGQAVDSLQPPDVLLPQASSAPNLGKISLNIRNEEL